MTIQGLESLFILNYLYLNTTRHCIASVCFRGRKDSGWKLNI